MMDPVHSTPPLEPPVRDARLSVVKVLASFGVVMVHTSMFALGETPQLPSVAWWSANLGNSLGRSASMLFVMVAGAVFLARGIDEQPWRFVWLRALRLLPALVTFSAFYFWWRHWQGEAITPTVVWRDLVSGTPYYHLWFLYAVMGLYILMPALRVLVSPPTHRPAEMLTLAGFMAYVWLLGISSAFERRWPMIHVALTPMMLPFLLAGHLLYRDGSALTTRQLGRVNTNSASA